MRSIFHLPKTFIVILLLFFGFQASAQILKPVKWNTKLEKLSDNEFNLVFEGTIDDGWHVYSQTTPDGGPLPLEMTYLAQTGNYQLIGKTTESKTYREYSDIFEVDEVFFKDKFTLKQRVKVINTDLKAIETSVFFQVCLDKCINEKEKFRFELPAIKVADAAVGTAEVIAADTVPVTDDTTLAVDATAGETPSAEGEVSNIPAKAPDSLMSIFVLSFLGGFAALLTPCVFPLIPMTVSYFTKQSKTKAAGKRNAIIYGISIIVIYVVLGSIVTAIFGADALNALATNVWFNLIFFILLVIFAMSFLGAFEIVLPSSWANKVDRQADRGGIIGILFMALALAIVSFSCTGPIVGTLLFESASRGGIGPIVGMLGFSLALALPFMLFAMFPGWLNTLPKSGGWLNTVKVFLGFLELALAFKFLSNADLVLQLHFLEREVFLAIWIAIFGALALYLFGKITLPHDSPLPFISVGRLLLGLLTLTFTIYLIPGLWGAPLKLISAFPPPMSYSESPLGVGAVGGGGMSTLPEGAKFGPHQLPMFLDYETGLAYAKKVNKPIMLDFTGHACVNCRKMENNVWSESHILPLLRDELVLISLYVDDQRPLPKEEQDASGGELRTIGDKWTKFMIDTYQTNTQPLYVLTNHNGKSLNSVQPTISYVGAEEYHQWLKAGLQAFKK